MPNQLAAPESTGFPSYIPTSAPAGVIKSLWKTLTAAQINALDVTPVILIPAAGLGTIIVPRAIMWRKRAVANWSTNATISVIYRGQTTAQNLLVNVTLSLGSAPSELIRQAQSMGGGVDSQNLTPADLTAMVNQDVVFLANLSNTLGAGSVVDVYVEYAIVTLLP